MQNDGLEALIAEAKRQNPYKPSIRERLIGLAKYQPFRAIWCARVAWLLHHKWNAPKGDEARYTLWQNWLYALSLADMMEDEPLSPSHAIAIDRQYWED